MMLGEQRVSRFSGEHITRMWPNLHVPESPRTLKIQTPDVNFVPTLLVMADCLGCTMIPTHFIYRKAKLY